MITSGCSAIFGGVPEPQPTSNIGVNAQSSAARNDVAALKKIDPFMTLDDSARRAGVASIVRDDIGCIP